MPIFYQPNDFKVQISITYKSKLNQLIFNILSIFLIIFFPRKLYEKIKKKTRLKIKMSKLCYKEYNLYGQGIGL